MRRSLFAQAFRVAAQLGRFWLQVVWQNSYAVPMEPGDLLVCDNYQAMHGRMSFGDGESRKVFVSATYD
jgi:hypothetical protein